MLTVPEITAIGIDAEEVEVIRGVMDDRHRQSAASIPALLWLKADHVDVMMCSL